MRHNAKESGAVRLILQTIYPAIFTHSSIAAYLVLAIALATLAVLMKTTQRACMRPRRAKNIACLMSLRRVSGVPRPGSFQQHDCHFMQSAAFCGNRAVSENAGLPPFQAGGFYLSAPK
jgi:hypothetical protein